MGLNRWFLLFLFVFAFSAKAQDRYMVFFTDKTDSPYSTQNPLEFLSQRAIDRQAKEGYTLTEEDFPVNQTYLQALRDIDGVEVYFTSRWMNAALVQMMPTLEPSVRELSFVSSLEFVAPNPRLSNTKDEVVIAEVFTDPAATTNSTATQLNMLGTNQLHSDGYTGEGILLAVFDGGFNGVNLRSAFADLHNDNRIKAVYDYVENSGNPYQYNDHGTRVLSCIAGKFGSDFSGTAPGVSVILAVTEQVYESDGSTDSEYRIEEYNWLFAAEMADSAGVDIINSSLGYTTFGPLSGPNAYENMNYTYQDMDGATAVITKAANEVSERGVLVVNSAGNSGTDSWHYIGAPADSPEVLTVGSVDSSKNKASSSSFGPTADGRIKPDVSAMGQGAVVVSSSGNITTSSGTSFSSPIMAGFAASLWQAYPDLTRTELKNVIKASGTLSSNPDNSLGNGIPNYLIILGNEPLNTTEMNRLSVFPNPASHTLSIKRSFIGSVDYELINIKGQQMKNGRLDAGVDQIDLNEIPSGIYFLQLKSVNFSETIKLLKK